MTRFSKHFMATVLWVGRHLGRLPELGKGTMVVCLKHVGITELVSQLVSACSEYTSW